MKFDKAKFISRFIDEAREHVKRLNKGLLTLEKNPDDSETLNAVFRSAHTIKGSSRMMRLIPISELAHKIEDILQAIRQHKIAPSPEISDLLFKGVDAVESLIDKVAAGEEMEEIPPDIRPLCDALEKAAAAPKTDSAAPTEKPDPTEPEETCAPTEQKTPPPSEAPSPPSTPATPPSHPNDTIRISSDKLDDLIKLMGEIVSGHNRSKQRLTEAAEIGKIAWQMMERFSELELRADPFDRLVSDLGRLVRSLHRMSKQFLLDFKEEVNIQGLLAADLQDQSIKMRMLPLSTLFDPFHRTVRNLARSSGKKVDLIISGEETELDKKIIEKIGDPLLHMIRNGIDHGIEPPEDRLAAGKPETGVIRLSARYEGGHVFIDLSDDGRGMNQEQLIKAALKKNLIQKSDLASLTKAETINLIFLPGLSTAEMITNLSGRGVGMDVVKQNIEELKGAIVVKTSPGKGTEFQIRLPLTMAIIHVLIIKVRDMTFAVPANYIDEIVRATPEQLIAVVDQRVIRLREQLVPVVDLADVLGLPIGGRPQGVPLRTGNTPQPPSRGEWPPGPSRKNTPHNSRVDADLLIMVASAGGERLGLVADALANEEEMVIKTLPPFMRSLPLVAGAIISGKNEVFNVLHIPKIIEAARDFRAPVARTEDAEVEKPKLRILVVDDSASTREIEKAILESYGYDVSLAADGREGYDKARRSQFDLIITDVEMPQMDGFTLTENLRKEDAYQETPIILVTSLDKDEDKRRGVSAGADAYIVKGAFDQTTLLDSVQNLIGN